jgi:hypothetical protein
MSAVYKTIVLSILLYGSETWVTNTTFMNKPNSFHNSCARTISGRHIQLLENGTWEYPSSQETLQLTNLLTIEQYIQHRKKQKVHILKKHNYMTIVS